MRRARHLLAALLRHILAALLLLLLVASVVAFVGCQFLASPQAAARVAAALEEAYGGPVRFTHVDLGFDPANVLSMNISLPTVKYAKAERQIAFFDELLRKINAIPGVRSASISAALPLTPKRITPILPEGQAEVPLALDSLRQ